MIQDDLNQYFTKLLKWTTFSRWVQQVSKFTTTFHSTTGIFERTESLNIVVPPIAR